MPKVFYAISALLLVIGAGAALFNARLILTSDLTFAVAANLLIFPINLFLQSLTFLALGLILAKLGRIERRTEETLPYPEPSVRSGRPELHAHRD